MPIFNFCSIFWVISLVFMTSSGHEINPLTIAAKKPPIEALAMLFTPWSIKFFLIISNKGNWIAENTISLIRVDW